MFKKIISSGAVNRGAAQWIEDFQYFFLVLVFLNWKATYFKNDRNEH